MHWIIAVRLINKIYFKRFNSFNFKWFYQWGRRLHHKILIVDQQKAIIGGINVTKSAFVNEQPSKHLDFAVYLEGPILIELTAYCESVFAKANQKFKHKDHFNFKRKNATIFNSSQKLVDLKLSINDWVFRRRQISKRYSSLIDHAEKEITIISSYFFPRKKFINKIILAAQRGVIVRLILPKSSDWPSYILASQYLYLYFLKNNVQIYQWNQSILHAKIAIIDDKYSTLGSFNLNYTSYQQNLEMNIDIESVFFTSHLKNVINELIASGCEQICIENFKSKATLKIRFFRLWYYLILATIANFSISLIYQEDDNKFHTNKYFSKLRIFSVWLFFVAGLLCLTVSLFKFVLIFFTISSLLIYFQLMFNKRLNN